MKELLEKFDNQSAELHKYAESHEQAGKGEFGPFGVAIRATVQKLRKTLTELKLASKEADKQKKVVFGTAGKKKEKAVKKEKEAAPQAAESPIKFEKPAEENQTVEEDFNA